jgi:hypothetical protein
MFVLDADGDRRQDVPNGVRLIVCNRAAETGRAIAKLANAASAMSHPRNGYSQQFSRGEVH